MLFELYIDEFDINCRTIKLLTLTYADNIAVILKAKKINLFALKNISIKIKPKRSIFA